MGRTAQTLFTLLSGAAALLAADKPVLTFPAYADTDICARLMVGPITDARSACSKSTFKDGDEPLLVRLSDNLVLSVNKQKPLEELVGDFVEATGEVNQKDGRIKLSSVKSVGRDSIPTGSEFKMLDVRQYKLTGDGAKTWEKIRHELAMLPYTTEFDFISFALVDGQAILSGWTVRQTNRNDAARAVKNVEGVNFVTNNIDVLPLGSTDMQIRAGTRLRLQRMLGRYFWGNGSDIKIIVKNGQTLLLGQVAQKADSDIAFIQANSVPGAFKVINMLRVAPQEKK
jgi:hyperosmotically inducible protein